MKKIGNIFCALGFIFYGIFLILKKINYDLGMYVFKFWPLLIVILGIELLVRIKKQDKVKISYLIIVIFVLFISTNGYYSSVNKMQNHGKNKWNKKRNIQIDGFNWHGNKFEDELDNALDIFDKKLDDLENELDGLDDLNEDKDVSIDSNKVNEYKKISTEKDLKISNNKIKISCKNLKIDIYNCKPNEARIKADIYIDKELNKDIKSYDIKESNLKGITNIKINEPYIKKVYVKIYLPKEVKVNLENFNSKIYSKDFCGDLNIKGSNGEVGLNGDIKECNINLINGKIKFKNNKCKSLNFNMKNGIINLDTKEKDLIINTDIRNGIVKVNKNKYINRGKNISMGKAINKINCKVLNGVININNEN